MRTIRISCLTVLMAGFVSACLTNHTAKVHSALSAVEKKAASMADPQQASKKMRKHRLPEGDISVDVVSSGNRLHLLVGKHHHGKKSLFHQYSDDQGLSWSKAVRVVDTDNLQANINRGKDAQIAVQGNNIVVTWMRFVDDARFNAGPMVAARSTDGGKTWQPGAIPPDWSKGPHGYTDMTADEQAMHAVWLDSRGGGSDVKASQSLHYAKSIDGGFSWLRNKTLDDVTCSCCWNTVKTDSDGKAYVLYRDKLPSDLAMGAIDPQQHWQRLNNVGAFNWQFDGCPHIGGDFDFQTVSGKTMMHSVVGTGHPNHLGIHYLKSEDRGETWSPAVQLGDESALHADIAAGYDGRIFVVWDMNGERGLAVFAAESKDQGKHWSKPIQLSSVGSRATHPLVIKTRTGFLSLWTEHDGKIQKVAIRSL